MCPIRERGDASEVLAHMLLADPAGADDTPGRNLKLRPGQIVLFTIGYKEGPDVPQPDFYGRWNPGNGQLVNISVWARQSRFGQPMLTGQTQFPLKGKGVVEAATARTSNQVSFDLDSGEGDRSAR